MFRRKKRSVDWFEVDGSVGGDSIKLGCSSLSSYIYLGAYTKNKGCHHFVENFVVAKWRKVAKIWQQ